MLKRYQRDVHGVRKFKETTDSLVKGGKLSKDVQALLIAEIGNLGLRITTESPRKTREAAAFTMWMCVYRPVTFDVAALPKLPIEFMEEFCATLNFFIASSYLSKFGEIVIGETDREIKIRTERIRRDFTCRKVCQSTLEVFYGAILRLKPELIQHENTVVKTSSFTKRKPRRKL
jgi:hypothetical protein